MTGLDRAWSYPSHKHESSLWDTVAAKSTSQDRIGVGSIFSYQTKSGSAVYLLQSARIYHLSASPCAILLRLPHPGPGCSSLHRLIDRCC